MKKVDVKTLSIKQIEQLIATMQNGVDLLSKDSREAQILMESIDKALTEVASRKKGSESAAQIPKSTPPPRTPTPQAQPTPTHKKRVEQEQDVEVVEVPELSVEPTKKYLIKLADGTEKQMSLTQIRARAKDNFRDVLASKFTIKNYTESVQFLNCVIFMIALHKTEYMLMPHTALHHTFSKCGEETQQRSTEIYNEIKRLFDEYKDK